MSSEPKEMPCNPFEHDRYTPETFRVTAKRGFRRIDGHKKASGKAMYTKDIGLPGMLFAKFLTSPYANAKIRQVDTRKADRLSGVRLILRYDDPEIEGKRIVSTYGGEEEILAFCAYFQVLTLGAVVAADTEDTANEALHLVEVDWDLRSRRT